jgi:hypothetical protein
LQFSLGAVAIVGGGIWWWALSAPTSNPKGTLTSNSGSKSSSEQWNPNKLAEIDSQTGALVVKSPDGGAYGILAVASANEPDVMWTPDGKLLPKGTYEIRGNPVPGEDYFLLFDYRKCRGRTDTRTYDPAGTSGYSSSVDQNGELLLGVWASRMKFPKSTRTVTFRTSAVLEQWRRLSTLKGNRYDLPQEGLPDFKFLGWDDPLNTDQGIRVGVELQQFDPKFWELRMVLVDKEAQRYVPMGGGSRPTGMRTFRSFLPELNHVEEEEGSTGRVSTLRVEAGQEFRAEVSPIDFVEFRNIALQPQNPQPIPPSK